MKDVVFQALADAARLGEPVALGIISRVKGSAPQKFGAKAVFHVDGRIDGTLGGGCLEAEIQRRAIGCLRESKPATFDLLLDHDFGWDDGLICGGKVEGLILPNAQSVGSEIWTDLAERKISWTWGVKPDFGIWHAPLNEVISQTLYQEIVSPACELWIAGAGHIAQAVAPLAHQLDFRVSVFDDRPALASHQHFPIDIQLRSDLWESLLQFPLSQTPTFALIVTRGHRHDALVLREWVHKPFHFIGMIGSRRKARTIFEHFLEEKLATTEELKRVACPVGLKIRSQTVMEIAVSIMAQFIEKRAEVMEQRARQVLAVTNKNVET